MNNKNYTCSKITFPFRKDKRIPRKFKKKIKIFCWVHYNPKNIGENLWYYLGHSNFKYKQFLIHQILNG